MTSQSPTSEKGAAPRGGPRALVIGVAMILVVAALLAVSVGPLADGPLTWDTQDHLSGTFRAGQPLTYGLPVVFNESGGEVRLISVAPAVPVAGLSILQTSIAGPDRSLFAIAGDREFPPEDSPRLEPVRGVSVPPRSTKAGRRGVELILGLRADQPGRYILNGLRIKYEAGGRFYEEVLPATFAVCASDKPHPQRQRCAVAKKRELKT